MCVINFLSFLVMVIFLLFYKSNVLKLGTRHSIDHNCSLFLLCGAMFVFCIILYPTVNSNESDKRCRIHTLLDHNFVKKSFYKSNLKIFQKA